MKTRTFPCTLALTAALAGLGGCAGQRPATQVAGASGAFQDNIQHAATMEDCTRILASRSSRWNGGDFYPQCSRLPGGVE